VLVAAAAAARAHRGAAVRKRAAKVRAGRLPRDLLQPRDAFLSSLSSAVANALGMGIAARVLGALAYAASYSGLPEQTHLSLTGTASSAAVSFVVRGASCPSRSVAYGLQAANLSAAATAVGRLYAGGASADPLCLYDAELTGLAPNTRYYYQPQGGAQTFSFTNAPARPGGNVYALLADFGLENAVSAQASTTRSFTPETTLTTFRIEAARLATSSCS